MAPGLFRFVEIRQGAPGFFRFVEIRQGAPGLFRFVAGENNSFPNFSVRGHSIMCIG